VIDRDVGERSGARGDASAQVSDGFGAVVFLIVNWVVGATGIAHKTMHAPYGRPMISTLSPIEKH
jgi:hypothetical protein